MLTGITYFEKFISPDYGEKHLENLAETGFCHVEFSPHPALISDLDLKRLVKKAQSLGLSTAFHNPDFIDPYGYSLNFYKDHSHMKSNLLRLFHHLADMSISPERIKFILHGASSPLGSSPNRTSLLDINHRAFDFFANEIVRQSLPIQLCLENTCHQDEFAVTQSAEDLCLFFKKHQGAPIDLCLDLPHWFRQCKGHLEAPEVCFENSSKIFFDRIVYAHLHGVSENLEKSHIPIDTENSFYFDFVKAFYAEKKEIIFNLEIFDVQGIEKNPSFESVTVKCFQLLVENCR